MTIKRQPVAGSIGGGGGGEGGAVDSVNGQTGVVVLTKSSVGLGNVTNVAPADLPISDDAQAALDAKVADDDARLTDARTPSDSSVTNAKVASGAAISADKLADGTTLKVMTATERTKLSGVATSATANSSDATLLARANHTGAQAISTVTGLQTALDAKAIITDAEIVATASTAQTLTAPTAGDVWYDLTLTAATCTLTLAGGTSGKAATIYLRLRQDATGGRAATFPVTVAWPNGLTPTLSPLPNALDVFALTTTDGGTSWTGGLLGPDAGALTEGQADTRYMRITSGASVNASDMGSLKSLSIDPRIANGTRALVAGILYCIKVKAEPGDTISNILYQITTAAVTGTNIYFAFYDLTGAQLSATSNLAGGTPFSAGSKTQAVSSFTVPDDGWIIVTILIGAFGTAPQFQSGPGALSGMTWGQDGTQGYPYFAYGTSLTSPPASLTLNSTNCTIAAPAQSAILLALT